MASDQSRRLVSYGNRDFLRLVLFTKLTDDSSCLFVRKREQLTQALSINPAYLRNESSDSGAVIDYRDWGISLSQTLPSTQDMVRYAYLWGKWFQEIRPTAHQTRRGICQDDCFQASSLPDSNAASFRLGPSSG